MVLLGNERLVRGERIKVLRTLVVESPIDGEVSEKESGRRRPPRGAELLAGELTLGRRPLSDERFHAGKGCSGGLERWSVQRMMSARSGFSSPDRG